MDKTLNHGLYTRGSDLVRVGRMMDAFEEHGHSLGTYLPLRNALHAAHNDPTVTALDYSAYPCLHTARQALL